jgi:hypothetical protein
MLGDQAGVWSRSAHARAFDDLSGTEAISWHTTNGGPRPAINTVCLSCHAPLHALQRNDTMLRSNEEGVGCEACHGPGSSYATMSVMRNHSLFARLGGKRGSSADCATCHLPASTDAHCPFALSQFDVNASMNQIAHPVPRVQGAKGR